LTPATDAPANAIHSNDTGQIKVALIEKRLLLGQCLARCIELASGSDVISFPSLESWLEAADTTPVSLIILCLGSKSSEAETRRTVSLLLQSANKVPTIILSDVEDPDQIVDALEHGVRGYVPTSVPLPVAINAMYLVQAGGVFVPATSLMAAAARSSEGDLSLRHTRNGLFTARQSAVVEALRRGKANKIIAYELNMRESTVKVHVRNIMKKLKAKNRTEVAFMTNVMADTGESFAVPRTIVETPRSPATVTSGIRK
jgi:DNA-binding NarL/FixJ family response regulator